MYLIYYMEESKDKKKITIIDLLKSHTEGLTISDIMKKTGLARHTVLARLHYLIGKGEVYVRQVNMAKLHYWNALPTQQELEEVLGQKVKVKPLTEMDIKLAAPKDKPKLSPQIDMVKIKEEIEKELRVGNLEKHEAQLLEQRMPISSIVAKAEEPEEKKKNKFIKTEVPGFDDLLEQGIPQGATMLVAGGAGSGKTIFCLQILANHAAKGEKCLYMSFEESEEKLKQHMEDFGWKSRELENKGVLKIQRFNPFDITRSVDALLAKAKGELLIEIEPILIPKDFTPDIIVLDSLTAIASAFVGKEDSYRVYIEQLFRFFEKIQATTFLITETEQIPKIFSTTGVEEFLADGVIVLYSIKRGNIRENAIEILKLRGAKHQKKIVPLQITNKGIEVYPEQELYSALEKGEA